MYIPEFRTSKEKVPILRQREIDDIAEAFIKDFQEEALTIPQQLEIEDFAEGYLGNIQDYQYLSKNGVYLGMTIFEDTNSVTIYVPEKDDISYVSARARTIIIDRCLIDNPGQEHRYRFTLAHEAGHSIFHSAYFRGNPVQSALVKSLLPPMILCRKQSICTRKDQTKDWGDIEWMEWQANTFASAFLMPRSAVIELSKNISRKHELLQEMVQIFDVSVQAAEYRIKELSYALSILE